MSTLPVDHVAVGMTAAPARRGIPGGRVSTRNGFIPRPGKG